jgi:hypothetical protein
MTTPIKRRLKYEPRFSCARKLGTATVVKLRSELARVEQSGNGSVQRFVRVMRSRYEVLQ